MAARQKGISGYHPSFTFNANGLQTAFPVAAAAGTLDPTKILDGTREAKTGLIIDECVLHLVYDGTNDATVTTYEVYRRRAGANTLLATLTLATTAANYTRVAVTPASTALRTVNVLDKFYIQPLAVGTAAMDATVEIAFT
jgi:hypothetical protein